MYSSQVVELEQRLRVEQSGSSVWMKGLMVREEIYNTEEWGNSLLSWRQVM
jgi:hypothetical protein